MPIDTAYNVQPVPEPRLDFSNILLRKKKEKHKEEKKKKKKKREKMRQKRGKVRRLAQRAIRQ